MTNDSEKVEYKLGNVLANVPCGLVESVVRTDVLAALAEAWIHIDGSDAERTDSHKLERAEELDWKPPILSFSLERHGRTVNGSSRADLHVWEVNVEQATAEIVRRSHRQLYPQDSRLNTKELAREIADKIDARVEDDRLEWSADMTVVVIRMGAAIPETNKQTTQNRRKRFREDLRTQLAPHGWKKIVRGNKLAFEFADSESG